MSKYFKLIDAINTVTTLNVASQQEGVTTYSHLRLKPDETYELGNDEVLRQSLQNIHIQTSYSQELVAQLKESGIKYQENYCKSCGGRIKTVSYNIIEFIDE